MSGPFLNSRTFSMADQLDFAELSGDRNPMHIDPVVARRTIYADVVVHGVHLLLWALDNIAQATNHLRGLYQLHTEFKYPVRLKEPVYCEIFELDDVGFKARLQVEGRVVVAVKGTFARPHVDKVQLRQSDHSLECCDLSFDDVTSNSGSLGLFLDDNRCARMFPAIRRLVSTIQVAEILATSRLVGMRCPGLHSIYASHNLQFDSGKLNGDKLRYTVTHTDRRFSMLSIDVRGPSVRGSIRAFVRPRPQAQAPIEAVRAIVAADEFGRCRALVIGGSRGLGEITAKILASGGADVCISYYRGVEDARRVTQEICKAGFNCRYIECDSRNPQNLSTALGNWKPNQLYYFATPSISFQTGTWFSHDKFRNYCDVYVTALAATVEAVFRHISGELYLFYPSTVFLQEFQRQSAEYCAAKAAGEIVCRHLEYVFPEVRVYAPRLPRMKTDQTSALIATDAADALEVMVQEIRNMMKRAIGKASS
jgi:acyl dehydratase/NAD(P)-dependent dehydrogenase (short-subunit alcohol dehydrogenase family)